jgi:peptidoglycan/xylan/chitin deacetylase (PgdA/CDA1 family)
MAQFVPADTLASVNSRRPYQCSGRTDQYKLWLYVYVRRESKESLPGITGGLSYDRIIAMPRAKREIAANLFGASGMTWVLEGLPRKKVLIVLNYHRIGDTFESHYDPGVFSASPVEFERQIVYLKRLFHITTLEEAVAMACGETPVRTCVLITFDDGYLDNYSRAFPILRSHDVQGVFFLPTSLVGTNHIPWWDVIAYIVRNSHNNIIRLHYPEQIEFDLKREGVVNVIMKILELYKKPSMQHGDYFIRDLEAACEIPGPPPDAERFWMNWQEVREMQERGMAFGSHTETHEILSKLSILRQREEALRSREALEMQLNRRICALAYPVGARNSFTSETIETLKSTGYRAGFSFYGGFNRQGEIQPFDIRRVGVGPQDHNRFRLKMALGALTGKTWF